MLPVRQMWIMDFKKKLCYTEQWLKIGAGHKVILPLVCEHTWCQTFCPWYQNNRISGHIYGKGE